MGEAREVTGKARGEAGLRIGLGRARRAALAWASAYAVAMAYVEAAVVIYLRRLGYAKGFDASVLSGLGALPREIVLIEVGREAATIVMLVAVAFVAERKDGWRRFAFFLWTFAVWDILYYVWLRALIGWPESLLTPDVLFLIPFVWVAPVVLPVTVSGVMMALALVVLRRPCMPASAERT